MGCNVSTSAAAASKMQLSGELSETQVEIVKETWPLLSQDLKTCGKVMFMRLFQSHPEMKPLFTGLVKRTTKLENHSVPDHEELLFSLHGLVFMNALGTAVDSLGDSLQLAQTLTELGRVHVSLQVTPRHLHKLWPAVDYMLKKQLSYSYTTDVRDAWSRVFLFMIGKMAEGMKQETDLQQQQQQQQQEQQQQEQQQQEQQQQQCATTSSDKT